MQDLRSLKQRIQAVRNIHKMADAMKMVSTVKYWRLQDSLHRARKIADEIQMFTPPGAPSWLQEKNENAGAKPPASPLLVLAFFPHRGMCGPLTQNLAKAAAVWYPPQDSESGQTRFLVFGRKGREAMPPQRYPRPSWDVFSLSTENMDETGLENAVQALEAWIREGRVRRVEAVTARFQNLLRQTPERVVLFPPPAGPEPEDTEVDMEPGENALWEAFLPLHLKFALRRVLLDCMVSEHASRMTAMDNASKNAGELIERFRLEYNKIRQSKITLELMEIISGSEALQ